MTFRPLHDRVVVRRDGEDPLIMKESAVLGVLEAAA